MLLHHCLLEWSSQRTGSWYGFWTRRRHHSLTPRTTTTTLATIVTSD
uniref:Uncharacterized protein n=1 Tax=Zea mays TaxID=4577 RepID=C0HE56_MAIZE|nr:unknown [Zea mays]